MSEKILSIQDIENCRGYLNSANNCITDYSESVNKLNHVLYDEEIVQTFFNSGLLGEDVRNKLETIRNILNKFKASYDDLSAATVKYLANQEEANNSK